MAKKRKKKYWDGRKVLKENPKARYIFALGGRSCGKTYSVLNISIDDVYHRKGMFAYIRRHRENIKQSKIKELFGPQPIEELTDGTYNRISYWQGFFYFEKWEPNEETGIMERVLKDPEPIGVALSINTWEGDKGQDIGAAHGGFKNIILDEAVTGINYLQDEFQKFKNVISSLVRDRTDQDTKIWLLANPLSKWCPYFPELGITKEMRKEPGHRYTISYPDTEMQTVFDYIAGDENDGITKDPVYDTFFAFPNSSAKSKSITGGFWELDEAEHLPSQVYKNSVKHKEVFMYFDEEWIRGEFMRYDNGCYYLVWTPASKLPKNSYYFILNAVPDRYAIIGTRTGHPYADLCNKFYKSGQVYYSDNTVADMVHGFMKEADKIVR